MTFHYDADLDQLAVRLIDRPSSESMEVGNGFVLDLDEEGNVVGFEVEHASTRIDLHSLTLGALPIEDLQVKRGAVAEKGHVYTKERDPEGYEYWKEWKEERETKK